MILPNITSLPSVTSQFALAANRFTKQVHETMTADTSAVWEAFVSKAAVYNSSFEYL